MIFFASWKTWNKSVHLRNSFDTVAVAPCDYAFRYERQTSRNFALLQKEGTVWLLWSTYAENKDGWISIKKLFNDEWHTVVFSVTGNTVGMRTDCLKSRVKPLKRVFPAFLSTRGTHFYLANLGSGGAIFTVSSIECGFIKFVNVICRNNEIRSDWFYSRKSLNYSTEEKIKKIKLSTPFDPTPTHKMPRWLIKPILCVQKAFIPSHQLKWKFGGMCLNCLLLWFSCYFLSVAIWNSQCPHRLRVVELILFF